MVDATDLKSVGCNGCAGSSPATPISFMIDNNYLFSFGRYQRPFLYPLQTAHGQWSVREGLIIQLVDGAGRNYWGEIAPIPWFGSECLEEAIEFCTSLGDSVSWPLEIPDNLPATQFAFSAAIPYGYEPLELVIEDIAWSFLLPAGEKVLEAWQRPWELGHRTFKWKIGVAKVAEELVIFDRLLADLPQGVKLRLDANAGLSYDDACIWLSSLPLNAVEFLEQPVASLTEMLRLTERFDIPLAVDELVSNLGRLRDCYEQGWRGIYVIKPCIAGSLEALTDFIQERELDVVLSSSLESSIGQRAILRWAAEHGVIDRSAGMATSGWFGTAV
jgi:o-succinylbenzoate synthase